MKFSEKLNEYLELLNCTAKRVRGEAGVAEAAGLFQGGVASAN